MTTLKGLGISWQWLCKYHSLICMLLSCMLEVLRYSFPGHPLSLSHISVTLQFLLFFLFIHWGMERMNQRAVQSLFMLGELVCRGLECLEAGCSKWKGLKMWILFKNRSFYASLHSLLLHYWNPSIMFIASHLTLLPQIFQ